MTMADDKCDICNIGKPIGVASCMMPMSVAYCLECASRGAQPEIVFETWYEMYDDNNQLDIELANLVETYKDGKYQTFTEWREQRRSQLQ